MPKFAPNQGFKMPGVGSKNIDSPGNFRDEQHVDKMGYCDNTPDDMLPEGSSPLKARYTTTGYRKDIKEVDINLPTNKCPKGSKLVDGKCVKSETKPADEPTPTPEKKSKGVIMGVNADYDFGKIKAPSDISVSSATPDKTTTTSYQGEKMSKKAWNALTDEERRRLNSKAGADKSGKITKTTPGSSSSISGKTIL